VAGGVFFPYTGSTEAQRRIFPLATSRLSRRLLTPTTGMTDSPLTGGCFFPGSLRTEMALVKSIDRPPFVGDSPLLWKGRERFFSFFEPFLSLFHVSPLALRQMGGLSPLPLWIIRKSKPSGALSGQPFFPPSLPPLPRIHVGRLLPVITRPLREFAFALSLWGLELVFRHWRVELHFYEGRRGPAFN